MRYSGVTVSGLSFNAQGWPLTAKKHWTCHLCADLIVPGDEYVKVQAFNPLALCTNCAPSVLIPQARRYPSHGEVYDSRVDWPERHRGDGPI